MGINLKSPTTFTTAVLIGDTQQTPGGSSDSIPTLTQIGGNPISAALEVQSTLGAFVLPRMTTAQITALPNVANGSAVYNSDLNATQFYQNGSFNQNFSQVKVTITAAQFNGMFAAPVQILPPAPAGYAYIVNQAILELVYGTAQFQNGGQVALQYGNTAGLAGTLASGPIDPVGIRAAVATTVFGVPSIVFFAPTPTAAMITQGLFLTNDTALFITGDSTFNLIVTYTLFLP